MNSCGQGGICTPEGVSHLIYSQTQLAALVPAPGKLKDKTILTENLLLFNGLAVLLPPLLYLLVIA